MPGLNPVEPRRALASARGSRLPLMLGDTELPAPPSDDIGGKQFQEQGFGSEAWNANKRWSTPV